MKESDLRNAKSGDKEINCGRGLKALPLKNSVAFVFVKKMKGKKGGPIRITIGHYPAMTLDEAEDKAREYRRLVEQGIHPKRHEEEKAERERLKQAEEMARTLTLQQMLDLYEKQVTLYKGPQSERTTRDRRWAITSVWKEYLDAPLTAITKPVVMDKMSTWPSLGQAKKTAKYMSSLYNMAIRQDYIEKNPFDVMIGTIPRSSGENLEYLEIKECQKLLDLIDKLQNPEANSKLIRSILDEKQFQANLNPIRHMMYDAIALQLLTGLRKREVLGLKWDQIYLSTKDWEGAKGPYFHIIKSKQKQPMGVPITKEMVPYFERRLANRVNDFVFPSPQEKEMVGPAPIRNEVNAMKTINLFVKDLKQASKIGSAQLRTTFATTAYNLGYTMEQIGLFTGHVSAIENRNVATKAYVNRQADSHREGFETINSALLGETEVDMKPIPLAVPKELDDAKTWDERIAVLKEGLDDLSEDRKVQEVPELSEKEMRKILIKGAELASKIDQ